MNAFFDKVNDVKGIQLLYFNLSTTLAAILFSLCILQSRSFIQPYTHNILNGDSHSDDK